MTRCQEQRDRLTNGAMTVDSTGELFRQATEWQTAQDNRGPRYDVIDNGGDA